VTATNTQVNRLAILLEIAILRCDRISTRAFFGTVYRNTSDCDGYRPPFWSRYRVFV
jgi:hypothetical protein